MKPSAKLTGFAAILSLALPGCAIPTQLLKTSALDAFKPIPNSSQAPCDMQKAVAEHNSVYDTLLTGKEKVYKAPCVIDKPKTS